MATKEESRIVLERVYNVPLRREAHKAPKYRRAKKAMIALREFVAKHMKTDPENVKIGEHANLTIWKQGMQYPPHHIKVKAAKQDDGKVIVELVGAPEKKVAEPKKVRGKKAEQEADVKQPGSKEEAKPKKLGKKAMQKELQQTQAKVDELAEKIHEHVTEQQETAKAVQHEEIEELKHEQETSKKHKPKAPQEDKRQYNRKKEMIPEGKR